MPWAGTPVQAAAAIPMMNAAGNAAINTAANYRQSLLGALLAPTPGGPMAWRSGVLSTASTVGATITSDLTVAQTPTASGNVLVAAGNCVVSRSGAAGGPYVVGFPTTSTLAVDPGASTNPRIDVVAVQLTDAAIGDSGTQGGQLIVVDGTPASTPAVPSIPANAIAIAQIYRPVNASTVVTANITDVRKGTCAYGGTRILLPGDQLTDAGSYFGEMRARWSAAYNAVLRDMWGTDGNWHGTQVLTGLAQSWYGGSGNILLTGGGVNNQIISVTIPDPGFPYTISASANVAPRNSTTWTAGNPPWAAATVFLDSMSGAGLAQSEGAGFLAGSTNANYFVSLPEVTSGVLTGSHTVILAVQGNGAGGAATVYYSDFAGNPGRGQSFNWLNVTVNPA